MKSPRDEYGLSALSRAMRAVQPWMDLGWRYVATVILGVAVGYGVDRFFGIYPWALIVGALLGIVGGFVGLIRSVNQLSKQTKDKQRDNGGNDEDT